MIYQLLIYTGGDAFSYDMVLAKQVCRSEYDSLSMYAADYINAFKNKGMSCLHIIVLKLDPINDITEVVRNEFYKHPLKKRVEINKKEGATTKAKQSRVQEILQQMQEQEAITATALNNANAQQAGPIPPLPNGIWTTVNTNNPNW